MPFTPTECYSPIITHPLPCAILGNTNSQVFIPTSVDQLNISHSSVIAFPLCTVLQFPNYICTQILSSLSSGNSFSILFSMYEYLSAYVLAH